MGALYSFVAQARQYELEENNRKLTQKLEDWNKNLTDWLDFIQKLKSEDQEDWQDRCNAFHDNAARINEEITHLRENIRNAS
jgi:predicted nuclease with TOPRIM domain